MRLLRPAAALLVLLTVLAAGRAADPDPVLAQDERQLRDARVTPDGPGLLAFFRDRTLTEAQKAKLTDLVTKLGDDDFEVREKASADLVKAGRLAVPLLKPAARARDAEVARRATDCLNTIEQGNEAVVAVSAAHVLAVRKPAGAAEVLLAYLPGAPDESVEEAVVTALGVVGLRDGKADAALVTALKDKEAVRRAAAASVVGRAGADQRKAVVPLLEDPDARVRLSAASALVRGGEKAAVPALIALVEKGPPPVAWQAEDLLFRIAGPDVKVPALGPGADAAKCRRAWDDWWKGAKVDLAKLSLEEAERGITLVCDVNGGPRGSGTVWECDRTGKVIWRYDDLGGPIDAHLLPGGRVLIAERHANRVTERDRKGTVLWEAKTKSAVVSCERLANGNTFIATESELTEVTRDGKPVYSHTPQHYVYSATRLRNGHIIYGHNQQGIVELDVAGKVVRTVPFAHQGDGGGVWLGVELLPNGRFLIGVYGEGKVVEIDAAGKRVWSADVSTAVYPFRLRNGNTLVPSADGNRVVEVDRSGKEVWSVRSENGGRPFRVRRY
jgi:outer membrane protein assembly factor BamB